MSIVSTNHRMLYVIGGRESFSGVTTDETLTGNGTSASPLGVNESALNPSEAELYIQANSGELNEVTSAVQSNSAQWSQGGVGGDYVPLSAKVCLIGTANSADPFMIYGPNFAFVQGTNNTVNGMALIQGQGNTAYGPSFAQGNSNKANTYSFAQGNSNSASTVSLTQGEKNSATYYSFAQGSGNSAYNYSFVQGDRNKADLGSLAQGVRNSAYNYSFVQGIDNSATGGSFSQGNLGNRAYSKSFAQGNSNSANEVSFAQGQDSSASYYSFAQGIDGNKAYYASFAQGQNNKAELDSFAQGIGNYASGHSIAQGNYNSASKYSQAFGNRTIADNNGIAIGVCNNITSAAFVIGNGTSDTARSDCFIIDHEGNVSAGGDIQSNGISLSALYNAFTAYTATH